MSESIGRKITQEAKDCERVQAVIGQTPAILPHTQGNISRERLMRAKAGILHLLTNVLPTIEDRNGAQELHRWLDGIYTVLQLEEVDALEAIQ